MENAQSSTSAPSRSSRRLVWVAVAGGLLALAVVVAALWLLRPTGAPASGPTPSPSSSRTIPSIDPPTPSPIPPPEPIPANTNVYDAGTLPQVDVFAVIPGLPVDDDPFGALTAEDARPLAGGAPIFADPRGEPVAFLPRDLTFDGTTAPIIEREQNWVRVLLIGRQSVPSQGNPAQVSGWLRSQDVEITSRDVTVEVSISSRTIDIVRGGVGERIATDFGWGAEGTPTPTGRAYIMTTRVEPSFGYTRGYPLVYLSVQSPTLDGFGGADVAVTAFHYHDERSGSISNGCLRVDPAAIERLAQLPLGTPVVIRP